MKLSTSLNVLYKYGLALAEAGIPSTLCRGCVQWCPDRTATPEAGTSISKHSLLQLTMSSKLQHSKGVDVDKD